MEFRNLEHTDFDTCFRSFERAFSDYEIHFDKEEVRSMLKRRGYNPRLSFAAFENGEIVSFTLNGIGMFNGIPTAYDTGTGTVKEYRGQGIAGKIFSYSLPYLKDAGIRQYLLEVLQNNNNAIAVYRRMNFKTTGEFDCFRQTIEKISNPRVKITDCTIVPVGIDFIRQAQTFCDFSPSWQNSIESIERGESELIFIGAMIDGRPVGFCVSDPNTGDITQIAVSPEYRRRGIASLLLHKATERMKTDFIKVLNITSDNQTLPAFLKSKNIVLASKQFEMLLQL
ncbi:MAG: GNAT family N-acetyltransferase [Muribaculaceae bacterium]|nr:GNAT family N-acetyltransferase [Bacteroides sp.]MDE6680825.1 GNAT family N-acetyltransferase [Muribaculaceae bacterium]MDE6841966.1 GNAT family N-acetyltransferase [Muribaculaceae bacterium]